MLERYRRVNERLNYLYYGRGCESQRQYVRQIAPRIAKAEVILDLGAGRSDLRRNWEGDGQALDTNGLIVAVDMDWERLRYNPNPVRLVADARLLPFPDGSVNLIATQNMFEHLEEPGPVLKELRRVLKQDGAVVFSTPRKNSYVSFVAALTPMVVHRWVARIRGFDLEKVDCCVTFYRLNSLKTIRRQAERAGLTLDGYTIHVEDPAYTNFLPPPLHFLFIVLHKLMERTSFTRRLFGIYLVGVLAKVDPPESKRERGPLLA